MVFEVIHIGRPSMKPVGIVVCRSIVVLGREFRQIMTDQLSDSTEHANKVNSKVFCAGKSFFDDFSRHDRSLGKGLIRTVRL